MNWADTISDVEDLLFPKLQLDVWERALYYHLLRRTRIAGAPSVLVSIQELSQALSISDWKAREAIRSLEKKGGISIEERTRKGHLVRALLPEDLGLTRVSPEEEVLDIEELDFYAGRKYAAALVQRENDQCFYCLREISPESCELDHLVPKVDGGDNSYRNIVASCHDCNSLKGGTAPEDYLRSLFRKSMLSAAELEARIEAVDAVRDGRLVPRIRGSEIAG